MAKIQSIAESLQLFHCVTYPCGWNSTPIEGYLTKQILRVFAMRGSMNLLREVAPKEQSWTSAMLFTCQGIVSSNFTTNEQLSWVRLAWCLVPLTTPTFQKTPLSELSDMSKENGCIFEQHFNQSLHPMLICISPSVLKTHRHKESVRIGVFDVKGFPIHTLPAM